MILDWKKRKPDFVNAEGFSWYIDKDLTDYCNRKDGIGKPLTGAVAYLVAKDNKLESYVVVWNQKIAYEHQQESVCYWIDVARKVNEYD